MFFHKPKLTMSASSSRQMLETKYDDTAAAKCILDDNESPFKMVPFDEYNKTAKLRSQYYKPYYIICHSNTLRSAGWLLADMLCTAVVH